MVYGPQNADVFGGCYVTQATQLIHTIAKTPLSQLQALMRQPPLDTEDSQAYHTLKNLFDQTRKVYSRDGSFIDPLAIQMFAPAQQEIIRKANVATFVAGVLGAHDVGFFPLHEFFLETFVPLGHRLLKWQGAVYLELKTQTYISALLNTTADSPGGGGMVTWEAMLDELFPPDLDAQILTRHPDAPSLSPSEQDFVDRCRARRTYLLDATADDEEACATLPRKYQWSDFVREFAAAVAKNVEAIVNAPVKGVLQQAGVFGGPTRTVQGISHDVAPRARNASAGTQQPQHLHAGVSGFAPQPPPPPTGEKKPIASATTGGAATAGGGSTTIRQPWTKAEEDALLAGLEQLQGPHWSQILALYGRGGSTSEVLKDRNQVQLKDKARNLKLWYLKMGREVPESLKGVTGELRKRGGARARAALGMGDEGREEEGAGGRGRKGRKGG